MRVLSRLALALTIVSVGCSDTTLTDPRSAAPPASYGISDGAHAVGGVLGNDDFYFLPPMVKEPSGTAGYKDDPFHAGLKPTVAICLMLADLSGCEAMLVSFSGSQIGVSSDHYHVNWDTKASQLNATRVYRISVFVGATLLGFADVDPVSSGSELRHIATGEYIGLLNGRTLPIKFRIERGALCTVDPCTEQLVSNATGGIVIAADGGSGISIPADALPVAEVLITVERKPIPPDASCVSAASALSLAWRQWEGCYEIRSDPALAPLGGFQNRVVVGLCVEPGVPADLLRHLAMFKFDEETGTRQLASTAAPFLDCEGFQGTPGPIGFLDRTLRGLAGLAKGVGRLVSPRPLYAIDGGLGGILEIGDALSTFFWGLPITAAVSAGDGQTAIVNTAVPIAPAVLIRTAHTDADHETHEVSEAPVTFTIGSGGGALVDAAGATHASVAVESDAAGIATRPAGWAWRLGTTPGANTLIASGPFENGPVTFSATAQPVEIIGAWLDGAELPASRRDQTETLLPDGDVLLVGGTASGALRYDYAGGSFEPLQTAFPRAQGVTATRLVDGRVLIVGGNGAPGSAEIFDPATNEFTALEATLVTPRSYHSATLLPDGRVLLAGGQQDVAGGPQTHASAEIFDPADGSFTAVGSLLEDRSGHAAVLLADGRVLIMGGTQTTTPGFGITLASAEIFLPASNAFIASASMNEARGGAHALILSESAIVFVYGGSGRTRGELYDPATGTFRLTQGATSVPHWAGSVTLLTDGRVLIAGGVHSGSEGGPQTIAVAEIYDPSADAFLPAAPMTVPRQQHSATRLFDGTVLVVGGYDFAVNADRNSSERFSLSPPIP